MITNQKRRRKYQLLHIKTSQFSSSENLLILVQIHSIMFSLDLFSFFNTTVQFISGEENRAL